jgi:hypothetical protein
MAVHARQSFLFIIQQFYFAKIPVTESSQDELAGMERCCKERRVFLPIWVPREVGNLGVDEMMGGNELKSAYALLILKEFENGDVSSVGHNSKIRAFRKEMQVKYGRLICQLLHEFPTIVRAIPI